MEKNTGRGYHTQSVFLQNADVSEAAIRLQAIFETAIDGIIIINERGIMEAVNPAAAHLFGYDQQELLGKNVSVLMPEPDHSKHDAYIERYLRTRHPRIIGIGREVNGLKKDGTIFPIRLAVSEVRIGERVLFTGIVHDLTEVKKAQEEVEALNRELEQRVQERTEKLAEVVNRLIKTNRRLEREIQERQKVEAILRKREKQLQEALEKEKELNELKSRFVSMASHEFRTPLSTIASSASLIARYTESDQQDKRLKHIQRIKSAVTNLTNILNDFLSLSKLEEGRIEVKWEEVPLGSFLQSLIEELESHLKAGQVFVCEVQTPPGKTWLTDPQLFRNIVFNLCSNAIKYSPEGKPIYVQLLEDEKSRSLLLRIRDEGMGIPVEDQEHLFTRFFRARNATHIQGTGLGLNIVRRYVHLLGGEITFQSEEGKGTEFCVSLPLDPPVEPRPLSAEETRAEPQ